MPDPEDVEEEEFIPYAYAEPDSFDPIWREKTSLEWNFELDHPDCIIDVRKDGRFVGIIEGNIGFDSGEHSYYWDGKIDGKSLEPGEYTVVITPNDEWSRYPKQIPITIFENIKIEVDVPKEDISLNDQGWYVPNNLGTTVTFINQTDEKQVLDVEIFIGDTRVQLNDFAQAFERLPHGFLQSNQISLSPGRKHTFLSYVFLKPGNERDIPVVGYYSVVGQNIGNAKEKSLKVPQANIKPIVFVPGILGSWLNEENEWVLDPLLDSYHPMMKQLEYIGYEPGVTLFSFPYDWRNDNQDTASLLKSKINSVMIEARDHNQRGGRKYINYRDVDILAHSMGGLVSRAYIQGENYNNNVNRLITVGTPHQGSPDAYLRAMGLEFDNPIQRLVFDSMARKNGYYTWINTNQVVTDRDLYEYTQDRVPAALQLLPWEGYRYLLNESGQYVEQPSNSFLDALNHPSELSKLRSRVNELVEIVGNGTNASEGYTVEEITVEAQDKNQPLWSYGVKIREWLGMGDGTVPYKSAKLSNLGVSVDKTIAFDQAEVNNDNIIHQGMLQQRQWTIAEEVIGTSLPILRATYEFDEPWVGRKINLAFNRMSPVNYLVTDPLGRRVGYDQATDTVINEIPGAKFTFHRNLDEPMFMLIPDPISGEYTVQVYPIEDGGEFTIQSFGIGDDLWPIEDMTNHIKRGEVQEYKVNVNMNDLRLSGVDVEWLLPGKNHQDISTINQNQTLPIKFSVRDKASDKFIGDLLEDMTVIVNKKGEDPLVTYIGTDDKEENENGNDTVIDDVYGTDAEMEEYLESGPNYGNSIYVRVDIDDEHYIVNFHARDFSLSVGIYEVRVVYKGQQIGRTEYFKVD